MNRLKRVKTVLNADQKGQNKPDETDQNVPFPQKSPNGPNKRNEKGVMSPINADENVPNSVKNCV